MNFSIVFLSSCKQCEPCCRDDCSECVHCKDMPKFGGVGKMKQCCLTKQCIAPILPSTASCQVCLKKKGSRKLSQLKPEEILYECERCMEIHHLPCFHVRKQKRVNLLFIIFFANKKILYDIDRISLCHSFKFATTDCPS